jgi:pimeloyl-ACP methyl ester carboxylesterase
MCRYHHLSDRETFEAKRGFRKTRQLMKDLVLLHGAIGAASQLKPLAELLSLNYNVHTLNFEGHGGRGISGNYSIDRFSENLITYLNENQLQKVSIFGYSMGGYVALKTATLYPERIEAIVTLGTKFQWDPETAKKETGMLDPEKIEEKVPRFAQHLSNMHSPLDWKSVLKGTAEMMIELGNGAGLSDNEITSIHIPVLIGIGEQDQMVSIEESKRVADLLPQGKMMVFENFPHPIDKVDLQILRMVLASGKFL